MADTKISALASLIGANAQASTDILPIVQTSTATTKKILLNELAIAMSSSPVTFTGKSMNVSTNTFNFTPISNSLGADVSLSTTALFFDGPSIAQGSSGTWDVKGTVTFSDPSSATFFAKLWDGTSAPIASSAEDASAGNIRSITLTGYAVNPVGNLRISVRDANNATGKILYNASGTSTDSMISAFRKA